MDKLIRTFDSCHHCFRKRLIIIEKIVSSHAEVNLEALLFRLIKALHTGLMKGFCSITYLQTIQYIIFKNFSPEIMDSFINHNGIQVLLGVLTLDVRCRKASITLALESINACLIANDVVAKILYANQATNIICSLLVASDSPSIHSLGVSIFVKLATHKYFLEDRLTSDTPMYSIHHALYVLISTGKIELINTGLQIMMQIGLEPSSATLLNVSKCSNLNFNWGLLNKLINEFGSSMECSFNWFVDIRDILSMDIDLPEQDSRAILTTRPNSRNIGNGTIDVNILSQRYLMEGLSPLFVRTFVAFAITDSQMREFILKENMRAQTVAGKQSLSDDQTVNQDILKHVATCRSMLSQLLEIKYGMCRMLSQYYQWLCDYDDHIVSEKSGVVFGNLLSIILLVTSITGEGIVQNNKLNLCHNGTKEFNLESNGSAVVCDRIESVVGALCYCFGQIVNDVLNRNHIPSMPLTSLVLREGSPQSLVQHSNLITAKSDIEVQLQLLHAHRIHYVLLYFLVSLIDKLKQQHSTLVVTDSQVTSDSDICFPVTLLNYQKCRTVTSLLKLFHNRNSAALFRKDNVVDNEDDDVDAEILDNPESFKFQSMTSEMQSLTNAIESDIRSIDEVMSLLQGLFMVHEGMNKEIKYLLHECGYEMRYESSDSIVNVLTTIEEILEQQRLYVRGRVNSLNSKVSMIKNTIIGNVGTSFSRGKGKTRTAIMVQQPNANGSGQSPLLQQRSTVNEPNESLVDKISSYTTLLNKLRSTCGVSDSIYKTKVIIETAVNSIFQSETVIDAEIDLDLDESINDDSFSDTYLDDDESLESNYDNKPLPATSIENTEPKTEAAVTAPNGRKSTFNQKDQQAHRTKRRIEHIEMKMKAELQHFLIENDFVEKFNDLSLKTQAMSGVISKYHDYKALMELVIEKSENYSKLVRKKAMSKKAQTDANEANRLKKTKNKTKTKTSKYINNNNGVNTASEHHSTKIAFKKKRNPLSTESLSSMESDGESPSKENLSKVQENAYIVDLIANSRDLIGNENKVDIDGDINHNTLGNKIRRGPQPMNNGVTSPRPVIKDSLFHSKRRATVKLANGTVCTYDRHGSYFPNLKSLFHEKSSDVFNRDIPPNSAVNSHDSFFNGVALGDRQLVKPMSGVSPHSGGGRRIGSQSSESNVTSSRPQPRGNSNSNSSGGGGQLTSMISSPIKVSSRQHNASPISNKSPSREGSITPQRPHGTKPSTPMVFVRPKSQV